MRKKVNIITITLFVLCCIAAIIFGWFDDEMVLAILNGEDVTRTWPLTLAFLILALLIGFIRFVLLYKISIEEKKTYVPLRIVSLDKSIEILNENTTNKIALVHVDNALDDKVVVRVFKQTTLPTDCVGLINK